MGAGPLERELAEVRRRELSYRTRLERSSALAERLHAHATALQRVLGEETSPRRLERVLSDLARVSSRALEVARTSVWLFDAERALLERRLEIVSGEVRSDAGTAIRTRDCRPYVSALSAEAVLAIEDAARDARLEGMEEYVRAHVVGAMLDIAIVRPGRGVRGVVCHEHVGSSRRWEPEEIDFARTAAALVGLAIEAQERIAAEREAAATDAKYRHLVEALPVVVYSFDVRTGALEFLSPQVVGLGGWTAAEWMARGLGEWVARVHEHDRPLVEERLQRPPLEGEIVYRLRAPDGVQRWIRDRCAAVRNPVGEVVALQGILADITVQREAELRSEESERRFLSVLAGAEVLGLIRDRGGRVTFVNEGVVAAVGLAARSLIGRDWHEVALEAADRDSARSDLVSWLVTGEDGRRRDGYVRGASGARIEVTWTDTVLRDAAGAPLGVASIGVDVTERTRRSRRETALTRAESLERLAAGVAHDFNNLLCVATIALEQITPSDDCAAESIADAKEALRQAGSLTRALLVYASHERLAPERVVVDHLLSEMRPLLQPLAKHLRLGLVLGAEGGVVTVASTHLRQLVVNLVTNAAQATIGHGTSVDVTTSIQFLGRDEAARLGATVGSYVVVDVRDDGRGIPEDVRGRVFEPYFTTKGDGSGTGIGLATCQRIVREAGGVIGLRSAVDVGTTFSVFLPASR